jgi:hypothetical protein
MPLIPVLHHLYDALAAPGQPTPIHPYIGTSFSEPSEAKLRVMAIGINAYVDANHAADIRGSWFRDWFATGKYRYQRAAWKSLDALSLGLVSGAYGLGHLAHVGMDSIYLTNAVKTYLPTEVGKRADQVADTQYDAHLPTWQEELRVLAEHDAFPHAIVIIGSPFWSRSCTTLALGATFGPARITARSFYPGKLLHYANRLTVESRQGSSPVWHLRIRHPASRADTGSAKWLLANEELAGDGQQERPR